MNETGAGSLQGMLEIIQSNINYAIDTCLENGKFATSDKIKIMGFLLKANQNVRDASNMTILAEINTNR